MSRPRLSGPGPCIAGCDRPGNPISGFCSDTCLQSMFLEDDVPVTVLSPNKAGGFGRSLAWQVPQSLRIPESLRIQPRGQAEVSEEKS